MRTRKPEIASFEALLATRYGQPEPRLMRAATGLPALLAGYYGQPPAPPASSAQQPAPPSLVLSIQTDDTLHCLPQCRPAATAPRLPAPSAIPPPRPSPAPAVEPAPAARRDAPPAAPAGQADTTAAPSYTPVQRLRDGPSNASAAGGVASQPMSDDDLLADIEAIVSGQRVYDPVRQMTVPKERLKDRPREPDPDAARAAVPALPSGDGQAIFDRIAQSMQFAGAYDLGTVELDNRFADFDRGDEQHRAGKAGPTAPPAPRPTGPRAPGPAAAATDTSELRADLDAIRQSISGAAEGIGTRIESLFSQAQSLPGGFSSPLYATGEHVLAADALYKDRLLVGRSPGVLFSYGQLIAMADLFETVEDMMGTDAATLGRIKSLIERSTGYARRDGSVAVNVGDDDWQRATDDRYLRLAEDNYEHFAPNLLFPDPKFASAAARFGDHRQAWQRHHEQAIREAQRLALDPRSQGVSTLPVLPLVINAFGDHFLTDAFAAGHVINKAAVTEVFRDVFYSGSSLNADGRAFFERVARQAWRGDLAAQFRQLETAQPHRAWWNVVRWHPDIKNAERFATVLQRAAEEAPEKVANLAVKAVHDTLNRTGVDVVNSAGSAPWRLTGDGHLTPQTLAVMRQAVAQSAAHITDPSILASNIELGNYFARVWAYVPQLTPAAQTSVRQLVADLVNPKSPALVDATATIVYDEARTLIKVLTDRHALQRI